MDSSDSYRTSPVGNEGQSMTLGRIFRGDHKTGTSPGDWPLQSGSVALATRFVLVSTTTLIMVIAFCCSRNKRVTRGRRQQQPSQQEPQLKEEEDAKQAKILMMIKEKLTLFMQIGQDFIIRDNFKTLMAARWRIVWLSGLTPNLQVLRHVVDRFSRKSLLAEQENTDLCRQRREEGQSAML